ncbi:bacillithiol biosynthesis cysteine-adding enzyme BshC [Saprospiraceae bacterium]|nr:bacillithiol biosynthesis cysteine-adding enzyme BshC [Saprospiraceae bacterium]MDC3219823.1 bacillithiol biosynthesis cysteine-adding enzyme BshC [Saprospiraceae bacterium]MDG1434261.1 bacillithiol biosynthesis cysteine-adding enzyme BshC [Saprospiraceae bacterium]
MTIESETKNKLGVKITLIPYEEVPQVSSRDKAYAREDSCLRPFYKYPTEYASFAQVIEDKKNDYTNRDVLFKALQRQYSKLGVPEEVKSNINKLKSENTFTIVTAHQPSLFTGPLYYIYKIISTINLVKKLNTYLPNYQFVPIFITGGEDHDFEEMNHVNLFSNQLVWENNETGSVGAMKTSSLKNVLKELKVILGETLNGKKIYELMEQTHTNFDTYSDAALSLVNELFGKDGLVCLNMNQADLKREFIPIIRDEIFNQVSQPLVLATAEKLNEVGFKTQASPREINFFYLNHQIRERIVIKNDRYHILNTEISFSKEEMENEIENHPEHFSPNVIMRPLFQELILPNLAYIGGGGELAYWLERKTQFEYFQLNFPMLIRRNSAVWIDKGTKKRMNKLGLNPSTLFQATEDLIKNFVKKNSEGELSFSSEKKELEAIFEKVKNKTIEVDASLGKTVLAESVKQIKSLENLESRVMRAEKQKHEVSINQIRNLKEKLFPANGLQERKDNFMAFYLKHGESYLETLKDTFDPLEKSFIVIEE